MPEMFADGLARRASVVSCSRRCGLRCVVAERKQARRWPSGLDVQPRRISHRLFPVYGSPIAVQLVNPAGRERTLLVRGQRQELWTLTKRHHRIHDLLGSGGLTHGSTLSSASQFFTFLALCSVGAIPSDDIMALERTKQVAQQIFGKDASQLAHPLDPLTESEIAIAVDLVRKEKSEVIFNSVNLLEPKKADLQRWLNSASPMLPRLADVIASGKGCKVYDVVVDITDKRILRWEEPKGVYPSITMEDLAIVEGIIRQDPKVIEQCEIVGVPRGDMSKVYW